MSHHFLYRPISWEYYFENFTPILKLHRLGGCFISEILFEFSRFQIHPRNFNSRYFQFSTSNTHFNTHAKVKNRIFDAKFPGNRFEFGIISNYFLYSTIWANHSLSLKILKIPEFNLHIPDSIWAFIFAVMGKSLNYPRE